MYIYWLSHLAQSMDTVKEGQFFWDASSLGHHGLALSVFLPLAQGLPLLSVWVNISFPLLLAQLHPVGSVGSSQGHWPSPLT